MSEPTLVVDGDAVPVTYLGLANASERTAPRAPEKGRMVMWIALPMAADHLGTLAEVVERIWPGATISNHDGGYAIREAVKR